MALPARWSISALHPQILVHTPSGSNPSSRPLDTHNVHATPCTLRATDLLNDAGTPSTRQRRPLRVHIYPPPSSKGAPVFKPAT
ncbi:hypothetical protein R3P38DRAFT_3183286 [Favolaschia claudopus]|uniref:Uncharacterized protein n=1 Tax=Favolaschia claudopus TaxID=2862362 RepID=A0AAW0CGS0_9AGAR